MSGHPRAVFKCQFRNADTVLEEVNMLAKLGNGIQRHVVLERQSAYLAKKPNNKAVSITAYLTKKPNNKAISITTKQSSSQLVNQ